MEKCYKTNEIHLFSLHISSKDGFQIGRGSIAFWSSGISKKNTQNTFETIFAESVRLVTPVCRSLDVVCPTLSAILEIPL